MGKTESKRMRLGEEHNAVLKRISEACRVNEATVHRWAIEALGAYFDAHGGNLLMPLDYRRRFKVMDVPMILHEPPSRVRPELVRAAGNNKMKTGSR